MEEGRSNSKQRICWGWQICWGNLFPGSRTGQLVRLQRTPWPTSHPLALFPPSREGQLLPPESCTAGAGEEPGEKQL